MTVKAQTSSNEWIEYLKITQNSKAEEEGHRESNMSTNMCVRVRVVY